MTSRLQRGGMDGIPLFDLPIILDDPQIKKGWGYPLPPMYLFPLIFAGKEEERL